jgi:hypothetical protein
LSLSGESIGEDGVGFGVVGVGSDCCPKLGYGFGELTALEEKAAAIESKLGTLPADCDATEISSFFAFGNCTGSVTLLTEDCRQGDVGTWLVGKKLDGATESHDSFRGIFILFIDVAEECPRVAMLGTQSDGSLQFGLGFAETAALHVEDAQGVMRIGKLRIELGRLL